jgi:hypothetical protein
VRTFIADFLDEAGNADEAVTILTARPDVQTVVVAFLAKTSMRSSRS